jgi:glycosyltransferase involved in cell wall biosynthesis
MIARMRVAVVTTSYPAFEGDPAGHFVRAEVGRLERDGHEVFVLAPRPGGAFGWPGATARIRDRPWRAFDAARWMVGTRVEGADRIVAHWAVPSAWPIAMRAAVRGGSPERGGPTWDAPLEVVSHGADVRLLARLPSRLSRAIAERAEAWRFASVTLLAELVRALDPRAARAVERVAEVAPPSIEMPDVTARAAEIRAASAGAPLFVSVGRLVPSKCVHHAIDRARRARVRLVVVGDGPERARLERRARGADVRFLGTLPRHEALAWIGAADALLFASRVEGLSTVVREAEALGVAVERL